MRTRLDKHSDAYAKCYSPDKHLVVDEIILLIKGMGPFKLHIHGGA
jgi:hypothetical protein